MSQVAEDEDTFLKQLEQSQAELQIYMAVEKLYGFLEPGERTLLNRLRVYQTPVLVDGARVVAPEFENAETLLERLSGIDWWRSGEEAPPYSPHEESS